MANRIIGLKNIHIAPITGTDAAGLYIYGTPVKLAGAKAFTTTNEVTENAFYSDDVMDYYSKNTTSMSLEIEMAYITPEVESLITGKKLVNGVLVSGSSDNAAAFAIMYEMTTLEAPVRRVIYDCILSRDEIASTTKTDSTEEQLVKLSGKAKPTPQGVFDAILDKNYIPEDAAEATKFNKAYDAFFTKVQTPEVIEAPAAKAVK